MEAVLATGRAEQRDCEKSHSSPWCQCKGQPSTQRQDESEPQQSTKHSRTVLIEQLPDRAQPTGTACMRRHQPVKHQGPRLIENTTPYLPMSTLPSHPLMLCDTLPATSRDKSWWLPVCQWPQQRCVGRCQRPSKPSPRLPPRVAEHLERTSSPGPEDRPGGGIAKAETQWETTQNRGPNLDTSPGPKSTVLDYCTCGKEGGKWR